MCPCGRVCYGYTVKYSSIFIPFPTNSYCFTVLTFDIPSRRNNNNNNSERQTFRCLDLSFISHTAHKSKSLQHVLPYPSLRLPPLHPLENDKVVLRRFYGIELDMRGDIASGSFFLVSPLLLHFGRSVGRVLCMTCVYTDQSM